MSTLTPTTAPCPATADGAHTWQPAGPACYHVEQWSGAFQPLECSGCGRVGHRREAWLCTRTRSAKKAAAAAIQAERDACPIWPRLVAQQGTAT